MPAYIKQPYTKSLQLVSGDDMNKLLAGMGINAENGFTATPGGGQAAAVQLINGLNVIATVASASDSAKLPAISPGSVVFVGSNGAQTAKIFTKEATGVTINTTAGATGVDLASNKNAVFFAAGPTRWHMILTA